ncbi:hypothetical protein V6N13_030801 [Hibiscus sabdariffa]
MDTENLNPTSDYVIIQSGRPPDPAAAVPASNDSMVTDAVAAVQTDLRVSPHPSFRDMIAGNFLSERKDNFISDLDVDLLDEDVIVNNYGVFSEICFSDRVHQQIYAKKYGHTKDACGSGNSAANAGVRHRPSQPSVEDRFRPWMQVVNRRRRPSMAHKVVIPDTQASVAQLVTSTDEQLSEHPGLPASSSHTVPEHMTEVVVQHQLNSRVSGEIVIEKPVVAESNPVVGITSVVIAAKDKVVNAPSSLKPETHKAVCILEENQPRVLKDHNGCQSYGPIRLTAAKGVRRSSAAVKNLPQKEGRVKKKGGLEGGKDSGCGLGFVIV